MILNSNAPTRRAFSHFRWWPVGDSDYSSDFGPHKTDANTILCGQQKEVRKEYPGSFR